MACDNPKCECKNCNCDGCNCEGGKACTCAPEAVNSCCCNC